LAAEQKDYTPDALSGKAAHCRKEVLSEPAIGVENIQYIDSGNAGNFGDLR
jgi:hypothetical protein